MASTYQGLPRYNSDGDRLCLRCKRYYDNSKFKRQHNGFKSFASWCRRCKALCPYGINVVEFEELLASQGGKCAIPGCAAKQCPTGKSFAVDHCHETGKIRGLLCRDCNVALGYAKDTPQILRDMANYLEANYGSSGVR